ncbi:MAG: ThiF family adenylyltransferase [Desulfarculaceae bacterium]|jgi:adenylyltransferase/sulfurtransferase
MPGRYQVQERLTGWGADGQRLLSQAMVTVVGVGALGGAAAIFLARAGVGRLRLIDPDRVSLENLHRQILFDEQDAGQKRPKALAGAEHLAAMNLQVALEVKTTALDQANAAELIAGSSVVVDGLDRAAPRKVLNRACLESGIPWVHGGVVGTGGQVLLVRPGESPCLECWLPDFEEPAQTLATHGVMPTLPGLVASLQASEALKLLIGDRDNLLTGLLLINLRPLRFKILQPGNFQKCPACGGSY